MSAFVPLSVCLFQPECSDVHERPNTDYSSLRLRELIVALAAAGCTCRKPSYRRSTYAALLQQSVSAVLQQGSGRTCATLSERQTCVERQEVKGRVKREQLEAPKATSTRG